MGMALGAGTVIRSSYMSEYWDVSGGATYRSVDPGALSATKVDASVIDFTDSTIVDPDRAAGYMFEGSLYCAAPVVSITTKQTGSFWAVGQDCCDRKGGFSCGDVADEKVHS